MLPRKNITAVSAANLFDGWCDAGSPAAKAQTSSPLEELCKECCAVANAGGGEIKLGLAPEAPLGAKGGKARDVLKKVERHIAAALQPAVKVEIAEVAHPQGRAVAVMVAPCPKGKAVSYEGVFYKNEGGRLAAMTIGGIASEADVHWLDEIGVPDLKPPEVIGLLDLSGFYQMSGRDWPDTQSLTMKDLANAGMIAPTKAGGRFSITRMGVLLLARRIEKCSSEVAVKRFTATRYKGTSKRGKRAFQRSYDMGHAAYFDDIMMSALGQMHNPYVIEGAYGRVIEFVPHVAVKELVLNAIIHQDFSSSGNPALDIYDDRVEIINPGEVLIGPDRMIDRHGARNPQLLAAMQKFGMAGQAGAGIDRIIGVLEREQAAPLEVVSEGGKTKVVLYHQRDYGKMTRRLKKAALYQHCVLKHVAGEMMTNGSARSRFNLDSQSRHTIWGLIKELANEGKIKPSADNQSSNEYASYLPYWA